jgi:hypothetical protein
VAVVPDIGPGLLRHLSELGLHMLIINIGQTIQAGQSGSKQQQASKQAAHLLRSKMISNADSQLFEKVWLQHEVMHCQVLWTGSMCRCRCCQPLNNRRHHRDVHAIGSRAFLLLQPLEQQIERVLISTLVRNNGTTPCNFIQPA